MSRRWPLLLALLAAGCDNMTHQSHVRPGDPAEARATPPHTVAFGEQRGADYLIAKSPGTSVGYDRPTAGGTGGLDSSRFVRRIPVPVTADLLARGRERFNIACSVCHGADGYGRGIVVRRGFPPPPSFHDSRLRDAPAGEIYSAIVNGYGVMYPATDRVPPEDRWAIVAYVRALQLSQHATLADVPPAERARLSTP